MEAVEQRRATAKAEADEFKKQLKALFTSGWRSCTVRLWPGLETLQAVPATKDLLPEIEKLEAEVRT